MLFDHFIVALQFIKIRTNILKFKCYIVIKLLLNFSNITVNIH